MSIDNIIQNELTKFDSVLPAIEELKSEFMPMSINGVDDKDGYEKVSKALRFMVSRRTAVEEKRKELKADSLAFGRAVDNRAKEITSLLMPIEEHLKNEKRKIDEAVELENQRIEKLKQDRIDERAKRLNSVGMFLVGNEFCYANSLDSTNYVFPKINLELFSDADFDEYITTLTKFHNENLEKSKKMKVMEEMYNKLKQERTQIRNTELSNLGLGVISWNNYWLYFPDKENSMQYHHIISFDEVENAESEEWLVKIDEIKKMILNYDEMHKQNIEKLVQEAIHKKEQLQKDLSEKANEEESNMSDKQKFDAYINRLIDLPRPELTTKKWSNYVTAVIKSLETFLKF